jgi:predicted amidohydrolase YtcJ
MLVVLAALMFAACATTPAAPDRAAPDLIVAGGRIFTADDAKPWAEALAVRGDRIVAVGSNAEVRALAGPSTKVIEVEGRVVVPGINDAHVHEPWWSGTQFTIADDASLDSVFAAIREAAAKHPPGTLLQGTIGWQLLDEPRLTRAALDEIAPRHPVMLGTLAGHVDLHNTAALQLRGINDAMPDPPNGWYGRDADGRVNGWVYEYARWRSNRSLAGKQPDDAFVSAVRAFSDEALRYGITSVQTMPGLEVEHSQRIVAQAASPLRWRFIDLRMEGVTDSPARATKYILDGTPLERGAALRADYADRAGHRGRVNFTDDDIARMLGAAARTRQPLLLHISGDLALEKIFTIMKAFPMDWPAMRVRIEHGDMIAPFVDDARKFGVVIVQNPSHFMLPELMARRFGAIPDYQLVKTLTDRGVHFAIGSDGPINPWLNVLFATLHPRNPAEALTREQAVIAYTRGAAFAEFAENEKGTLAPGKLADFVVLSDDVFTVPPPELPRIESMLTVIGGKIAFERLFRSPR